MAVKGAKELAKKLKDISDMDFKKAMNKATLLVEGQAKEDAPVLTGDLQGSIHPEVKQVGRDIIGRVYTALEYAPYVEFGTGIAGASSNTNENVDVSYDTEWGGQEAQPYLYPALHDNRGRILKIFNEDMVKQIRQKAKGGK